MVKGKRVRITCDVEFLDLANEKAKDDEAVVVLKAGTEVNLIKVEKGFIIEKENGGVLTRGNAKFIKDNLKSLSKTRYYKKEIRFIQEYAGAVFGNKTSDMIDNFYKEI